MTDWTPVNEPLTTARFSALYGHWYPHAVDEATFWLALLNEVEGTCAAMREVRHVNPAARLIQTEDLGQAAGRRGGRRSKRAAGGHLGPAVRTRDAGP